MKIVDKMLNKNGAALIAMALFFAAVGILFGLGRLASYKYQVKRRINRQYQVDKMLATRSAVNLICSKPFLAPHPEESSIFENVAKSNLLYEINGGSQTLICDLLPTDFVDFEMMKFDSEFEGEDGWKVFQTSDIRWDLENSHFLVQARREDSNSVSRCAIFKKAPGTWRDSEFGYLYRIDPQDFLSGNGAFRLKFMLVATGKGMQPSTDDNDFLRASYYLDKVEGDDAYPTISYEMISDGTTPLQRVYQVTGTDGHDICYNWIGCPDQSSHAAGFLLSDTKMVGFVEDDGGEMSFTDVNFDLSGLVNLDHFDTSWICIDHTFSTNIIGDMSISIDNFSIKEPMNYSISVYNSNLKDDVDCVEKSLMTWVLLTKYGIPESDIADEDERQAKSMVMDVFGREPASLSREREGLWPKPGVE